MRDRLVNSLTIALLSRQIPIHEAADLIEDYARMMASEASLEASREAYNRTLKIMGNTELLIAPGV